MVNKLTSKWDRCRVHLHFGVNELTCHSAV